MFPVLPVAPVGMVWFGNRSTVDPNEIDFFDDGDISDYTNAATTAWNASTTQVEAGSHSLNHPGSQGSLETIRRDDGGTLVEDGDTFRIYYYIDSAADGDADFFFDFATQDASNYYRMDFDGPNGRMIMRRFSTVNGNTSLGNVTPAGGLPTQEWAYAEVDFHETSATDWTVELFDAADNSLGSNTAANEDEFSAGGIAFTATTATVADIYIDSIGYV